MQHLYAQSFEEYFEDATLRLDYIFAGNANAQHVYLQELKKQDQWAGRRNRLAEKFLNGNGQLTMKDHNTQQVIYVWTFSTLFQEWLQYDEAKQVDRAFEASYNVPFPKKPIDVTITLTNNHQQVITEMTHTVDPKDILIRKIGDNGIPFQYVWKGQQEVNLTECIDIAIVAEGYTEAQMSKFHNDCNRVVEALFAREPFKSLKHRFNVVAVATPSAEEGPSVPHNGIWHTSSTGSHYDTFYTDRYLMTQEMHKIYDLLSSVPFEHIMVMVNTDTYGGGGIYNQVTCITSDHPTFKEVLVHEFGHSYAGLADEYAYDDMDSEWYPADTEPWEPNITTLKDFDSKWADMVPQVGVFEGAGYQSKGCYRPAQDCRMRTNEAADFCPVCTRAIQQITDFYTAQ
jgi:hypothetical protein